MKSFITVAILLALGASAQSKPAPLNMQPISLSTSAIDTGPALTTLEADYFRAPQQPYAAGIVFPCRLELRVFEKTRLAQSCNRN